MLWLGGLAVFSADFRAHLTTPPTPSPQDMKDLLLLSGALFLYFIVCEMAFGRTLGKRLMGLTVVHENGGRASLGQLFIRNLLRPIDLMPGAYILGMALVLMGPRPQRLGDRLARTLVVTAPAGPLPESPSDPRRP